MTMRGIARAWYDRVQAERIRRGWTVLDLERETGVSRSAVDRWKAGTRPPQAAKIGAVADALGVPRGEALRLAGHTEEVAARSDSPVPGLSRETLDKALRAKLRMLIRELGPELGEEAFRRWVESIAAATADSDRDATRRGAS